MDKVTGQAHREWLEKLVDGEEQYEYKPVNKHWNRLLRQVWTPFQLRLINGMRKQAFEATFLVDDLSVLVDGDPSGCYQIPVYSLHIAKLLNVRNR